MTRTTEAGEVTVAALCRLFGVSRSGYYAARRGPAGEAPAVAAAPPPVSAERSDEARDERPRPKGRRPAASAERVVSAIREVVAWQPAWGVRKVWATLRRRGIVVARKRVWSLMRYAGLLFRAPREVVDAPRGHVSVPEPNRRFATDLTMVWTRCDGWVAVVPTIDCGCRSVLGMVVAKRQEARVVLASVDQALEAAFGEPSQVPAGVELRTDHGAQYTGSECRALLSAWGVEHTFAPVGRPTGNAVVERLNRTLKEEVIWLKDWDDAAEVERAVRAWVGTYNDARPHQALGGMTPSEYRAARLGAGLAMAA